MLVLKDKAEVIHFFVEIYFSGPNKVKNLIKLVRNATQTEIICLEMLVKELGFGEEELQEVFKIYQKSPEQFKKIAALRSIKMIGSESIQSDIKRQSLKNLDDLELLKEAIFCVDFD